MPTSALVDREDVRAQVDAVIESHLESSRAQSEADYGSDTGALFDAMEQLLSGGKRLRAAFTYWSWRAHGGQPNTPGHEAVIQVGAALELFQAAALFHDDVMDKSDTRRGKPTAHVHFARMHSELDWPGDAAQFGLSAAILLGDLALVASEQVFGSAVELVEPAYGHTARLIFDNMRAEVTIGQYLDVLSQVRPWLDDAAVAEADARAVIRSKSARYSVEHPISIGAALAGADQDALAGCSELGLPLGEAFQLRDDVLGVFGDPAQTGKPAGDDLREGKRTVMLARAMGRASNTDVLLLQDRVGSPGLGDDDIEQLRAIFVDSGALSEIETLISELTEHALGLLTGADLDEAGSAMLRELGLAATSRSA